MRILIIPCIAMASINFFVTGYYLFFYFTRPQIKEHLPFAFLCLSVGLYDLFSAGLYSSHSIQEGMIWQYLQLDTMAVIAIFLIWFTLVFTKQQNRKIIIAYLIWFTIILISSIFTGSEYSLSVTRPAIKNFVLFNRWNITYYEVEIGIIYKAGIISVVAAYVYIFYLFSRYFRTTRNKILILILASHIIYFLGIMNDSMIAMRFYSFVYISEYSFFCTVMVMAYTLLDRFVKLHKAYEELNINLEQKVYERTSEIEQLINYLKNLVDHDALTGVFNRRFFNEYLEIEVDRANNSLVHKTPYKPFDNDMNFGLSIIDIDNFKQINDTYGHPAGDSVLKQVTSIIKKNIFTRDMLFRYGGDEFALLLTKTTDAGIHQAAEKIRKEIFEYEFFFENDNKPKHVTISIGLVAFDEVADNDIECILKLADNRLLKAKRDGRNRIICWDNA